ncbi:MAG TPA: ABC-F family ATP-binding cassette domain-containing protein, partial [Bacteroidetes bacterium]|nr:ABC-F family ATP-binding cassette domain-containing protein [Bacteroidota bacterium]
MIRLTNIGLSFGAQLIFKNMSWHLCPEERVGLIGPNGAGKTTLLQILLERQLIDAGTIRRTKNMAAGYLPQDRINLTGKPLLEETLTAFDSVLKLEREIHSLQNEIDAAAKSGKNTAALLDRLGKIQQLFEHADGYRLESEAKKILKGLGFTEDDWQRETSTFSGGWQMRIALAKLLLQRPNLLMLDEPTNHLDVQTTEWLENYLQNYDGAFILVSHDRYFLDRTVKKIVSLERGGLQIYHGNYTRFEQERKKRIEIQWGEYYRQKEEIERIQKFIDRFRYKATKAAQVQSRIKMLEKMPLLESPEAESHVFFHFPPAPASGKLLIATENAEKYFAEKQVFANVSFRCDRCERIAIVGVNGAGKSTLCRILAGIDTEHKGEIFKDNRLKIGYYSQDIADRFSGDTTVLTEAQSHAETI